jgi:Putative beta-barrel porin-2, OmpL-like. bbp2
MAGACLALREEHMKRMVWSVLVLSLAAAPAWAQTPPAPPAAPEPPSVEVGGLVDTYYDYYSTKPADNAPFRNFDTKHDQFALSMAEIWLKKAPTDSSRVGFNFKLSFGPASSEFIHGAEPGGSTYQNIQEAYVSYLAPAGKGLQIDAGVFVTPAGAEVIEAKDNPNYSRGLLFALAIPYYHSGLRLTYNPSDKVTVMGGVVNGWNNIVDNNTGKTLMGAVTLKPTGQVTVYSDYLGGPEQPDTNSNWRHLSDTVVTFTAAPNVSVIGNYDYGHEAFGDGSVHWQGVAGVVKYQATPTVAFAPRLEYFDDADGFSTGTAQKLKEVTATLELKASDSLLWRIEYRNDWSDQEVFVKSDDSLKKSQQSIGFGLLFSFGGKIQ